MRIVIILVLEKTRWGPQAKTAYKFRSPILDFPGIKKKHKQWIAAQNCPKGYVTFYVVGIPKSWVLFPFFSEGNTCNKLIKFLKKFKVCLYCP